MSKLRYVTDAMLAERKAIGEFLPTIMKGTIETMQLTEQIHGVIGGAFEDGADLEGALTRLDKDLQMNPTTSVSGDNFHGWRTKHRYLTETQRNAVLAMVRIVYTCGGAFSLPEEQG